MALGAKTFRLSLWCVVLSWLAFPSAAQELEPRRWTHLPVDTNFAAVAFAHTESDIAVDPVTRIDDVNMDMDSAAAGYIRTFALFEKLARVEVAQAWHDGHWTGTVNGIAASIRRRGLSDTRVRFAVNLLGSPPLADEQYAAYRAATDVETIVGIGLEAALPTGDYDRHKLINLGTNRFTFSPQVGVVHNRGKWGFEATGAASIYTPNESFFDGSRLETNPFYTIQAHVVYTHLPGLWAAVSGGYGVGGQSELNGDKKDDRRETVGWAISAGFPITRWLGVKAAYIGRRHQSSVGANSDDFILGLSTFW